MTTAAVVALCTPLSVEDLGYLMDQAVFYILVLAVGLAVIWRYAKGDSR